jgi:hypothetical protein
MATGRHMRGRSRKVWVLGIASCVLLAVTGAGGYIALHRTAGNTAAPAPTAATTTVDVPPTVASPSVSSSASATVSAAGPRLLFGMGTEADAAIKTPLVKQAPVRMLTSWYNGPKDLSWITRWKNGIVRQAYAAGFALHLIVFSDDPEVAFTTPHGPACGRAYPLSSRFASDMTALATTFGGRSNGPPLYVTLFTEFQTYPCRDNGYSADEQATTYYLTLKDQFRAAHAIFHEHAPNARVSLGWGGWQANFDDPAHAGGRSMFEHFADVMRLSEFQSFQAMDSDSNAAAMRAMVRSLSGYGPVMLAHYQSDADAYAADVRAILTDAFLGEVILDGLFAMSFMDDDRMSASAPTFQFVRAAVQRYGRAP